MLAYHISRSDSICEGKIINLLEYPKDGTSFSFMAETCFDSLISNHGYQYLNDPGPDEGRPHLIDSGIEFELELIRRSFFPKNLSRYQAFYALESLEDLSGWLPLFSKYPCRLFEIEFDHAEYEKHDASLMPHFHNRDFPYSPSLDFEWAYKYWSGESGKSPLYELLIKPPVLVKKEIRLPILTP